MFPNLFQLGTFTIHSYGLLLAIAFLAGLRVALHYGKREQIEPARITDLVLYIFVSALVGAKLLHIIVDFSYYSKDWSRLLQLYRIGGVYYGGLILAVVVSVIYMRRHKMNFWRTADAMCMGLATGQIFGRSGCFLAGCCWGKEVSPDFPFGVTFRSVEAANQVGTPLFIPLHPTQVYEAFAMLCVLAILVLAYRRKKYDGQQLFLYLFLYSVLRFCIEFFRGDPRGSVFGGALSTSQLISLIILAGAFLAFLYQRRSWKSTTVPVA